MENIIELIKYKKKSYLFQTVNSINEYFVTSDLVNQVIDLFLSYNNFVS